jgi:hypothetical protein
MNREESYRMFLEDRESDLIVYNKIMSASLEELSFYLTSPCEEERWLARIRLRDLKTNQVL